jgi:uncharacterized membrane protein YbhN (UPF0104 family)
LLRSGLQVVVTGTILAVLAGRTELGSLSFARFDLRWFALGVLTTVPQLLGSALRWSFAARRLGAPLPMSRALGEYYVSSLVNQLLPTGIAGDALRVTRHASFTDMARPAYTRSMRAVVLERTAGQLVLWCCVAASTPLWGGPWSTALSVGLGLLVVGSLVLLRLRARTPKHLPRTWLSGVLDDTAKALVDRGAVRVHVTTSLLTLLSCVAMFGCAARAISAPLELAMLARIAPLVLVSMAVPVSFAGWGVRELATTALYAASGLDPGLGASTAVIYGLMSLVGSLPGLALAFSSQAQK